MAFYGECDHAIRRLDKRLPRQKRRARVVVLRVAPAVLVEYRRHRAQQFDHDLGEVLRPPRSPRQYEAGARADDGARRHFSGRPMAGVAGNGTNEPLFRRERKQYLELFYLCAHRISWAAHCKRTCLSAPGIDRCFSIQRAFQEDAKAGNVFHVLAFFGCSLAIFVRLFIIEPINN